MTISYDDAMGAALVEAELALSHGDVPVGAVIVHEGRIIASRHNERELTNDPTAHAEILAIRDAAMKRGTWRLTDCTIFVTLEPCVMCAGALWAARFDKVVFAAPDLIAGAMGSAYSIGADPRLNHEVAIELGPLADDAKRLLQEFFSARRDDNS
jgi:tRNA(adenine34) deaminase